MSARSFLIHGLIAGFLAGVAAFLVAHQVGEPNVNAAIAIEEAGAAAEHMHAVADSAATEEAVPVSRAIQSTVGLGAGTLAVGTALGGLLALVAAGAMGRLGRFSPGQSTAVVAALGLLSFTLVPFLKYPASPPAVGNPDTIGSRTGLYFGFLAISVVAAIAATVLAQRVWRGSGTYAAVVAGGAAYLAIVGIVAAVMPSVNEAGAFPAGTLWSFRVSSLLTLVTLWTTLGVVLTGLVLRQQAKVSAVTAQRELAASL
jgi:hypothetical protein